jgi:site-specific recombinase XerD
VFFTDTTYEVMREHLRSVHPQEYLLVSVQKGTQITDTVINRIIRNIKKDLKIPKEVSISPHKFRHTYASKCLNNGANLIFIQKTLGHSTIQMTQRYTHKNNAR